jgi:hypothetical protein
VLEVFDQGDLMILFQEIHLRAMEAAQKFKRAEADLIAILQEVESTRTFFKLGYTSLFQYVVQSLSLSESVAANFVTVSRKAKEFPALQLAIDQGDITVSKARKVTAVLTAENQEEWVKKAVELPQRKLEEQVANLAPETSIRDGVRPITETLSQLKVGISRELEEKLKRVQDLESQRTKRAVKLSEALEVLADLYLEKKDPVKKAERVLAKKEDDADACVVRRVDPLHRTDSRAGIRAERIGSQADNRADRIGSQADNRADRTGSQADNRADRTGSQADSRTDSRALSSEIRHRVNLRDGGRCTHTQDGKRCESRRWLDIHHIVLRSHGGTDDLENLKTLCSSHHRMEHQAA